MINIAVIDSGIDTSHSQINTIAGGVKIQIDDNQTVHLSNDYSDYLGHGTACAGIIKQFTPKINLYSVKIFDNTLTANSLALVVALQWCINNKIDVVNISLGTEDAVYKTPLKKICRNAIRAGSIIIAAQNNEATESLPAILPEVIGVTGGLLHTTDNYYYRPQHPIECIANNSEQSVCWLNNKHVTKKGNSFAAPHITAIVTKLLIQNPQWSLTKIRTGLKANATKVI